MKIHTKSEATSHFRIFHKYMKIRSSITNVGSTCGIRVRPTVNPATRSPNASFVLYRGNHFRRGILFLNNFLKLNPVMSLEIFFTSIDFSSLTFQPSYFKFGSRETFFNNLSKSNPVMSLEIFFTLTNFSSSSSFRTVSSS